MSFQVGTGCYADLQAAGAAACSLFSAVTSVTGGGSTLSTVTCDSSGVSGELVLKISTVPIGGGAASSTLVTMPSSYQPCMYGEFVDAGLVIFAALLAVWALTYGPMQLYKLLHWSRGDV